MPEPALNFIRRNASLFARVGSVVATYRTRGNARFGPYYRLIYREDRRQRSLYLGPSEEHAAQVRQLLTELQRPRDERVALRRSNRLRKATLLQLKREWQHVARACGLRPHGWNVRGLRALGWPRIDKTSPLKRLPYPHCNHTSLQQPAAADQDQPNAAVSSDPAGLGETVTHHTPRYCPNGPRAAQLALATTGSLNPPAYTAILPKCTARCPTPPPMPARSPQPISPRGPPNPGN